MSKPKARRVNYRINYCSSQDPDNPVSQLVLQSAEARGWVSKRFAPFPQTVIIQLLETTVVTNLAFLSHQNKICTRIDIEGKQDHEDNWSKLGYTTLQSGVNTNYQSRQLRNINLGGKVLLLLKFTFSQNYTNHINIFNQIGIIALLVYGQKATVERQWVRGKQGSVLASLSDLDRETIMKLKNLEQIKRDAIEEDRFDDVKNIKEDIQQLQGHLPALILLEKQKKELIKRQDYDGAKQVVERMKKLRGPMVFHKSNPLSANNSVQLAKNHIYSPKKKLPPRSAMGQFNDSISAEGQDFYRIPDRRSEPRSRKGFDLNTPKRNNSSMVPFDQIKISARQRYPVEEQLQKQNQGSFHIFNQKKPLPPKYSKSPRMKKEQRQDDDQMLNPRPLPILKLQKLTPDQVAQCNKFFPIFNEVTFEYLFSRDHLNRQKGIAMINGVMNDTEPESNKVSDDFVTAGIFAVRKTIDDRIMSVLTGIVDFFGMMMKKFRPGMIGPASKNVRYILQKLAQYLGHNNQKFRQTCQDVFASLPSHKLTNRQLCFEVLMANPKQKSPRIVSGKLRMLDILIEKYHLSQDVDDLIDFGKRYLEDKNSEVRVAAVGLMASLSRQMGYQNLYQDLQGLKPQVIKMIEDQIEADGGVIKKIEMKKNNSVKKVMNTSPKSPQKPTNPEYYCDFCKVFDKRLENQNFRDQHLYSSCKMITLCPQCNQAIEVSSLNNHHLAECQKHKYFKRCPKCKEAVPSKEYNQHTKMKECISAKAPAVANRCPLCHEDIQTGDKGWVKHLVTEGCPNNPRT